jgi:hypothetical protein
MNGLADGVTEGVGLVDGVTLVVVDTVAVSEGVAEYVGVTELVADTVAVTVGVALGEASAYTLPAPVHAYIAWSALMDRPDSIAWSVAN